MNKKYRYSVECAQNPDPFPKYFRTYEAARKMFKARAESEECKRMRCKVQLIKLEVVKECDHSADL